MKTFVIFLLSLPLTSFAKINPYKCKETKDCIRTYHGCGRFESVHRKYSKRVEDKVRKMDRKKFCTPPTTAEKEFFQVAVSICEEGECKLVKPEDKE